MPSIVGDQQVRSSGRSLIDGPEQSGARTASPEPLAILDQGLMEAGEEVEGHPEAESPGDGSEGQGVEVSGVGEEEPRRRLVTAKIEGELCPEPRKPTKAPPPVHEIESLALVPKDGEGANSLTPADPIHGEAFPERSNPGAVGIARAGDEQ